MKLRQLQILMRVAIHTTEAKKITNKKHINAKKKPVKKVNFNPHQDNMFYSYRSHYIDLQQKTIHWFLHECNINLVKVSLGFLISVPLTYFFQKIPPPLSALIRTPRILSFLLCDSNSYAIYRKKYLLSKKVISKASLKILEVNIQV